FGVPAGGPVPPESPYSDHRAPEHDTARADSLLDAAGWRRGADGVRRRNGRPFAFDLLTVGSGDNALEQLVQADLGLRGIHASIRQVELGTFLTNARARDKTFDVLVAGVPGDVSLAYVGAMFDSRQAGGALDYSGYHTAALDSLFAAPRRAPTEAARAAAWRVVQNVLDADAPVAWLYHSRGIQGISARLHDVTMDLRGEMDARRLHDRAAVSVLISPGALDARRAVAAGPLAALASSLVDDLAALRGRELYFPRDKARLS